MAMNVEAEICDLKRRVGELEGTFGFPTEQIQSVHRDLLTFQARTESRLDRVESRLDRVEGRLGGVEGRLDRIEKEVRGLRKDMPGIVATTMRDVLREQRGNARKPSRKTP
jgi:hypothetical protein